MSKRVAVIGLDGMPWHVLNRLFEYNAMPNLKRIIKSSLRGILKSTVPPSTPPAWTSIATGVNPGKHGIFSFVKLTNDYNSRILNSGDVRYPRIYEMLALLGLKSVSINLPLTSPIAKIKGTTVISDWMSPNLTFYPTSIKKYAKSYHPYIISHLHKSPNYFHRLLNESSSRVDAVNAMMEELDWDLFLVIYSEPDNIMHEDYRGLINNRNEIALKILNKIDETIREAVRLSDLVLILSDHGFSEFNYLISVNTLLYNLGLAFKTWRGSSVEKIVDHASGEKGAIKRIQVPVRLYGLLSFKPLKLLLKRIFRLLSGRELRARLPGVNIKDSTAFYLFQFKGIWVKDQKLIDPLIRIIKNIEGIKSVWRREELFHGPYISLAPHIVLSPDYDNGYQLHSSSIYPKLIMKTTVYDHHPHGIFIAYGREVSPGWAGEINCEDVVPTILNYLELPIPSDTDGKIINGISFSPKKVRYYNYLNHWLLTRQLHKLKHKLKI